MPSAPSWRRPSPLVVIVLILMVKPTGLFGSKRIERV